MQRERHHVRFQGENLDVLVEPRLAESIDNGLIIGQDSEHTPTIFHFLLKLDKSVVGIAIDKVKSGQVNGQELFVLLFGKERANVFLKLFSIKSPDRIQGG